MTIVCNKCKEIPLTYTTHNNKNYCMKCIYDIKRHLLSDKEIEERCE